MPAIQSRDCPQELYDRLSQCAQEDHRSISQELIVAIEGYLEYRERKKEVERMLDVAMPLPPKPWEPGYRRYRESERERTARLERRREVFKRIDAMPRVDIPEGFPTIEEMVREDRDSR